MEGFRLITQLLLESELDSSVDSTLVEVELGLEALVLEVWPKVKVELI